MSVVMPEDMRGSCFGFSHANGPLAHQQFSGAAAFRQRLHTILSLALVAIQHACKGSMLQAFGARKNANQMFAGYPFALGTSPGLLAAECFVEH